MIVVMIQLCCPKAPHLQMMVDECPCSPKRSTVFLSEQRCMMMIGLVVQLSMRRGGQMASKQFLVTICVPRGEVGTWSSDDLALMLFRAHVQNMLCSGSCW